MKPSPQTHAPKYSSKTRFWHWANTLVISGSLLTVLVNATLFDGGSSSSFIQKELANAGASVSQQQARSVAHGLEDQVWDIHSYFGYALAALFIYRVIVEIASHKDYSFIQNFKLTLKRYLSNQAVKSQARYELGIKSLYLLFYVLLFVMVATGLTIAFKAELGLDRSFSHSLKEIHGFCMYPILGFIALHIGGVYLAENKDKKGIVSDMINGGLKN